MYYIPDFGGSDEVSVLVYLQETIIMQYIPFILVTMD